MKVICLNCNIEMVEKRDPLSTMIYFKCMNCNSKVHVLIRKQTFFTLESLIKRSNKKVVVFRSQIHGVKEKEIKQLSDQIEVELFNTSLTEQIKA